MINGCRTALRRRVRQLDFCRRGPAGDVGLGRVRGAARRGAPRGPARDPAPARRQRRPCSGTTWTWTGGDRLLDAGQPRHGQVHHLARARRARANPRGTVMNTLEIEDRVRRRSPGPRPTRWRRTAFRRCGSRRSVPSVPASGSLVVPLWCRSGTDGAAARAWYGPADWRRWPPRSPRSRRRAAAAALGRTDGPRRRRHPAASSRGLDRSDGPGYPLYAGAGADRRGDRVSIGSRAATRTCRTAGTTPAVAPDS